MATAAFETQAPRRDEALAFIVERILLSGISPTFGEIAIKLAVSKTRVKELVAEFIQHGIIERTPGSQRGLRVVNMTHSRDVADIVLRSLGWTVSDPMGHLQGGFPKVQLPVLPPIEHLPEPD